MTKSDLIEAVAEHTAVSLGPIATSMVHIARTDDGDEAVVPVINLEHEEKRRRKR